MSAIIDFSKTSLYLAIAHILFNPIFWNTVARAGKHEIWMCTCHPNKMLK